MHRPRRESLAPQFDLTFSDPPYALHAAQSTIADLLMGQSWLTVPVRCHSCGTR